MSRFLKYSLYSNKWTWYPCGVACGAGELVEQGSDLTGGTWTTNAQYLRAGGGCSSMLIRRKSSTDDEYHHEDPLGAFGVITGASGAVLSSSVYDAFMGMQYVQGVSKTTQPATCQSALSEPSLLTGSGGRGLVVPSRGFQVMGHVAVPVKKHPCKKQPSRGPHDDKQCDALYHNCMNSGLNYLCSKISELLGGGGVAGVCTLVCSGGPITAPACVACLAIGIGGALFRYLLVTTRSMPEMLIVCTIGNTVGKQGGGISNLAV